MATDPCTLVPFLCPFLCFDSHDHVLLLKAFRPQVGSSTNLGMRFPDPLLFVQFPSLISSLTCPMPTRDQDKSKTLTSTLHSCPVITSILSKPCIVAFRMLYVKCWSWTDCIWTFPPYGPLRLYGSRSTGSQESPSWAMTDVQKVLTLSRTACRTTESMGLPKKICRRVWVLGTRYVICRRRFGKLGSRV